MLLYDVDLEYVHADAFANYTNITVSVQYDEIWVFSIFSYDKEFRIICLL